MENFDRQMAYMMAKHKAKKLKRFYVHGIVYVIVNIILIVFRVIRNLNIGESFNEAFFDLSTFSTAIIWGVFLAMHTFSVFGPNIILGHDWEEAKLKKFMKEDEENKTF